MTDHKAEPTLAEAVEAVREKLRVGQHEDTCSYSLVKSCPCDCYISVLDHALPVLARAVERLEKAERGAERYDDLQPILGALLSLGSTDHLSLNRFFENTEGQTYGERLVSKVKGELGDLRADLAAAEPFRDGWRQIEDALGRTDEERAREDLTHYVPRLARDLAAAREERDRAVRELAEGDGAIVRQEEEVNALWRALDDAYRFIDGTVDRAENVERRALSIRDTLDGLRATYRREEA